MGSAGSPVNSQVSALATNGLASGWHCMPQQAGGLSSVEGATSNEAKQGGSKVRSCIASCRSLRLIERPSDDTNVQVSEWQRRAEESGRKCLLVSLTKLTGSKHAIANCALQRSPPDGVSGSSGSEPEELTTEEAGQQRPLHKTGLMLSPSLLIIFALL